MGLASDGTGQETFNVWFEILEQFGTHNLKKINSIMRFVDDLTVFNENIFSDRARSQALANELLKEKLRSLFGEIAIEIISCQVRNF